MFLPRTYLIVNNSIEYSSRSDSPVDAIPGKEFQMKRSNLSVTEWADGNYEGEERVSCVNHALLSVFYPLHFWTCMPRTKTSHVSKCVRHP